MKRDRTTFYTFAVVLIISFFVSFSRMKNPFAFSGALEKILAALVLLFIIYFLRKISMKAVRKRLSAKNDLFIALKNVIISAVLGVASISSIFLSFREIGYVSLVIAVLGGVIVVLAYLSLEE